MNAQQINNQLLAWIKEQQRDLEWQLKSTERILDALETRLESLKMLRLDVENRRFEDENKD